MTTAPRNLTDQGLQHGYRALTAIVAIVLLLGCAAVVALAFA